MLEGEKNVKNINCLAKVTVIGIVGILASCGGKEKQIMKLPVSEMSVSKVEKLTPEAEVTVGTVEQVVASEPLCIVRPGETVYCGIFPITNESTYITIVIEEPRLAIML